MLGTGARLGTTYSSIIINQKFIEKHTKTLDDHIKDL
jgi:hypothetical protein